MSVDQMPPDHLVKRCVIHLKHEFQSLSALSATLEDIGRALKLHETNRLTELLVEEKTQIEVIAQVQNDRQTLQREIASSLATTEDVRISDWAKTLDQRSREQILNWCRQIFATGLDVVKFSRTNMAVASRGVQIHGLVLDYLTNQGGSSKRYNAEGRHANGQVNVAQKNSNVECHVLPGQS